MSSRARAWILFASGAVLVAVSGALLATAVPRRPAEFGWYAYAPATKTAVTSWLVLDPIHRWASLIGLAGLVAMSWAAGFLAGRRHD